MFKKVATLQFKKIYASDSNGNYYWRDFVKQANSQPMTDANFIPKNFYEYDTKNFLYITARAISGMEKWGPNGNFDAFPWEELKKSYPTFCGKGYYIEHKEDDEMDAKGIILDAQSDDDNEFINCICAISKQEYPEICEDILNGKLNQVSMSCLAAECECSKCHNVATKEEELCEHMNPEHPHFCKGQTDSDGKPIYEINRNIVFTGLSGVAVPADKDAFIFDVKASKKQNSKTINKEYNKYCRAKKEYEYINSLLEKEDTRKYIESQLNKQANNLYKVKVKTKNNFDSYLMNARNEEQAKKRYLRNNPNYKPEDIIVELATNEKDLQNTQNKLTVYLKKYNDNDTITSKEEIENFIEETGTQLKVLHNGEYILINPNGEEFTIFDGYTLIKINNELYIDTGGRSYNKIATLNKKADVEYMSDTIKEIPPIDFETEFMLAGKSKGCNSDINKDQLELGIKVEMEHTTNPVIAEKIACDHIKEIPNYYTLLAEMEASAKVSYDAAKQEINKETNEEFPTKLGSKQFFKVNKSSKQFFKVNKANKNWFKIANIDDDSIDQYGLTQLERETISDVIYNINKVNEDTVITWSELIESIPAELISINKINKNKVNIMDYIENELGQKIEAY